ncbi:MAG: hypothetical protein LC800_06825, partial [Acidobacteria bacterium]|nr:hypothetical protein [Acidobacteriota bacterium]
LTLEDVNRAIKEHLQTNRMRIVMVTKDGEGLRDAIVDNKPSPITYNSPKPADILEEDKAIQTYPVNVQKERVRVVPIDQVFQ